MSITTLDLNSPIRFNVGKLERWQLKDLAEGSFESLMEESSPTLLPGWSYHRGLEAWLVRENSPNPQGHDNYPEENRSAIFEEEWPEVQRAALTLREARP